VNSDFVHTVLLAIGALLPIVDPLGSAPIYRRLTAGLHRDARPALARLVAFECVVDAAAALCRAECAVRHRAGLAGGSSAPLPPTTQRASPCLGDISNSALNAS